MSEVSSGNSAIDSKYQYLIEQGIEFSLFTVTCKVGVPATTPLFAEAHGQILDVYKHLAQSEFTAQLRRLADLLRVSPKKGQRRRRQIRLAATQILTWDSAVFLHSRGVIIGAAMTLHCRPSPEKLATACTG